MSPHHTVLIAFPSTSNYLCISWAISTNVVFLVQDIIELKCSEFEDVSRAVLQFISETCTIIIYCTCPCSIRTVDMDVCCSLKDKVIALLLV